MTLPPQDDYNLSLVNIHLEHHLRSSLEDGNTATPSDGSKGLHIDLDMTSNHYLTPSSSGASPALAYTTVDFESYSAVSPRLPLCSQNIPISSTGS